MDTIAEQRVEVLYPNGRTVSVHLAIGRPHAHPKGDFACPVSIDGLSRWEGPKEICGVSSLQALMLGIRFLCHSLRVQVEHGAVLHWEGGEEVLELDDLFGRDRSA